MQNSNKSNELMMKLLEKSDLHEAALHGATSDDMSTLYLENKGGDEIGAVKPWLSAIGKNPH